MAKILVLFVAALIPVLASAQPKPKVFVLTDINLEGGDPDDRQSFIHLLWYSDELEIVGIVPDSWNRRGYEACLDGLSAYQKDFVDYGFGEKGLMPPGDVQNLLLRSNNEAIEKLRDLSASSEEPIYVLVWGSMVTLKNALFTYPEIADDIRVLSIGTGRKYGPKDEVPGEDCDVVNWNGRGRNAIYEDERFTAMWWLESNWTYNGMFMGEGPTEMFERLQQYGAMGKKIKTVTSRHPWAQYFRVGDTPSVTYLLDPGHDPNDPETSSWAGLFKKPFPQQRPNYYTDDNGPVEWDYADPCSTWHNLEAMYVYNKSTLVAERQSMYDALIEKLDRLYDR